MASTLRKRERNEHWGILRTTKRLALLAILWMLDEKHRRHTFAVFLIRMEKFTMVGLCPYRKFDQHLENPQLLQVKHPSINSIGEPHSGHSGLNPWSIFAMSPVAFPLVA